MPRTKTMSRVLVTLFPTIPNDGQYIADTVAPAAAGRLIADAMDSRTASLHVTRRNCADMLEHICQRTIGSQWLRATTQAELYMDIGDVMICLKLTEAGKRKIDADRQAAVVPSDYDFVRIERTA